MSDGILIRDLPAGDRPRERMVQHGADALRNAELIAILLRTGTKGISAMQVADELLKRFATLEGLAQASLLDLQKVKGIGRDKAIALKGAFTLAKWMAKELQGDAPLLDTPARIADYLREDNKFNTVEYFQVILLNARRKLIRLEPISHGTLDSILVHPREVFRAAISANAAGVVLVHNHPSGDPTPSEADIKVTRDIIRAGQLLKIDVLDHVILGKRTETNGKDYASLRELGYFYS